MIATLAGGKRDYDGVDLIFRKRYSNNWQALVSYTYNRARGNTNSDSQRRLPGRRAVARSAIAQCLRPAAWQHPQHLQGGGVVHDAIGVLLGASYRWNSGAYSSETVL